MNECNVTEPAFKTTSDAAGARIASEVVRLRSFPLRSVYIV